MAQAKITAWVRSNKRELFLIAFVVIISAFLRLYRINDYLIFLGDQGRDMRVVRDLLKGNLVFIGPQTSVGNAYLGPFYYYLIAPSLFISSDPSGPAIIVALLSVATVFLIWLIGRVWFGQMAALIGAFLYATSPLTIKTSTFSWNPNPLPLASLLVTWFIYKYAKSSRKVYLLISAALFGLAIQLHYLAVFLLPLFLFIWVRELILSKNSKNKLFDHTISALLVFFVFQIPLLLYDIKHNFLNLHSLSTFFSVKDQSNFAIPSPQHLAQMLEKLTVYLFYRPLTIYPAILVILFLITIAHVFRHRHQLQYSILYIWSLAPIFGLAFYHQPIYSHYFGMSYPAYFLLIGISVSFFIRKSRLFLKLIGGLGLFSLTIINIANNPLFQSPNRLLWRTRAVTELIRDKSNDRPFNFGLIAKQNYDESYRYFFENEKAKLIRGENGITDQLFVVCEDGDTCQPEGNSQWQIAVFGPAKVVEKWQIDYISIYRLIHSQ